MSYVSTLADRILLSSDSTQQTVMRIVYNTHSRIYSVSWSTSALLSGDKSRSIVQKLFLCLCVIRL